jgi:hypothetical protein
MVRTRTSRRRPTPLPPNEPPPALYNVLQVAHQCSFVEPFLGLGGGYVQVTRATGVGPVLLLLPLRGTSLEAWRPLRNGEDAMRLDFMYEMSYELVRPLSA